MSLDNERQAAGRWITHRLGRHLPTRRGTPDARSTARHLYGTIIVLAVLVTANDADPEPYRAAAVLAATVAILLGMESYADVLAQEIVLRRPLSRSERTAAVRDLAVVAGAAQVPLVFLVLAGAGVFSAPVAFALAQATTIALLFYYGYLARRLAGRGRAAAAGTGLFVAGLGLVLAIGKAHVHL